jgi:hypothetical protein
MPKKMRVKLERTDIPDLPVGIDYAEELSRKLSEEMAKALDNQIIEELFQINYNDNVALLEKMYPGQNPHDALRSIGLGDVDLHKEYSLHEKIRTAKINSITE